MNTKYSQSVLILSFTYVHPSMFTAAENQPDNFDEIFQGEALLAKYLKEKCWSEH